MFAEPRSAFLSGTLQHYSRLAKAFRDWFQEAQRERESGTQAPEEWLSPEQWAQYEMYGFFDVTGSDTGRRYRIRHGTVANVHEIDEAGQTARGLVLCSQRQSCGG